MPYQDAATFGRAERQAGIDFESHIESQIGMDLQTMDADKAIDAAKRRINEVQKKHEGWADSLKPRNEADKVILDSDVTQFKLALTNLTIAAKERIDSNKGEYEARRKSIVDATQARARMKSELQPEFDRLAPILPKATAITTLDEDFDHILNSVDNIVAMGQSTNTLVTALETDLGKLVAGREHLRGDMKKEVEKAIPLVRKQIKFLNKELKELAQRYDSAIATLKSTAQQKISDGEGEIVKLKKKSADLQTERVLDKRGERPGKKPITDTQLKKAYDAFKEKEVEVGRLREFLGKLAKYKPEGGPSGQV